MMKAGWVSVGCMGLFLVAMAGAQTAPQTSTQSSTQASTQTGRPAVAQLPQSLSHGRFENLTLYRPAGEVKRVVLFLSGDGGWEGSVLEMSHVLQQDGALVIGIDTDALFRNLDKDAAKCVFPDGDLENLSHFVQAYYKLPGYKLPLLVGYSAGASLAYAVLAQAPPQTFAGALSMSFCVDMELHKTLCKGESVHYITRRDRNGVDLLPSKTLATPWIALHGSADHVCPMPLAKRFASKVSGSEFIVLPGQGHHYEPAASWQPQFRAAVAKLDKSQAQSPPLSVPKNLGDLPIIEVNVEEGAPAGDSFAVLLSGDGGWAGLDKEVASALAANGIPVVGVDSLRYFWSERTPAGTAVDVDRIVRYYLAHWQRKNVILIGYSQGADVMPFVLNRLPAATRQKVALTALLGLGTDATFEFHLGNWIGSGDEGLPIKPEVARLGAAPVLCLYGEDEEDSLCPELASATFKVEKMAGGHHFDGDYDTLARLIMKYARH